MPTNAFALCDDLGPEKILHVSKPGTEMRAIVVVDNTAAGVAIGGARMALDASLEECARLARAMTLKNAAAGLPHGGAKSVIIGDPSMSVAEKERVIRSFACAIQDIADYIPGPDMGTNETAMAWVRDEIGRSVGLPREIGGIPLDEIGATGFGLSAAAETAQEFAGVALDGARVVVQGFGAVGKHAARFLSKKGAMLVGASDSSGAVANAQGLDVSELIAHKAQGAPLSTFTAGDAIARDAVLELPCDILIPAARPDALHADNVERIDCKLVLQGANIPATPEAEARLHARGVMIVPDFIANAGGVICAAVEYRGGTEALAFAAIDEKIRRNTEAVLTRARSSGVEPRTAALELAEARVRKADAFRRWR